MAIEGVIRPPQEIRVVADKTAAYVAKNGRAFEARILGSGKGKTPKFAFLHPTSPFHAYYEDRIRFYENGGEDKKEEEEKKSDAEDQDATTKAASGDDETKTDAGKLSEEDQKKKEAAEKKKGEKSGKSSGAIDPVAKALLTQRGKIAKTRAEFEKEAEPAAKKEDTSEEQQQQQPMEDDAPPPIATRKQHYTPPAPPSLDLAHIVAPASLTIAQVETIQLVAQFTALDGKGGPFFARLSHREWANPAFSFCQPRHGHFAYFSALVDAYRRIYETWTAPAASSQDTNNNLDVVHQKAGNVDKCLEMAAYRVAYEHDMEEQTRKKQTEDGDGVSEVAQIDWHDFVVVETIDFPADEKVELAMLPPPPPPKVSSTANSATVTRDSGGDGMEESDDEDGETIRVVPSYTPRVVSTQAYNPMEEVIDPITGKSVKVKDMPEHMRIQLLDPKWAEERKKFQDKQKDSNLVGGDMIASNISRFSREAFGGKTEHDLLSGETDAKKRLDEANRIIREQSQRGVGPSLPPPVRPAAMAPAMPPPPPPPPSKHPLEQQEEPEAKRQRLEGTTGELGSTLAAAMPAPVGRGLPPPPTGVPQPSPTAENGEALPGFLAEMVNNNTDELLSAEEFVKTLSKPEVTLQVRIPNDPAQMAWNFYGQIVSLSVDVKSKVKSVKQELSRAHLNGMPANKIQLKTATGFLKDSMTLAQLNMGPTAALEMIPKTRGGRK